MTQADREPRSYPDLLSNAEQKALLSRAEGMWRDLQANNLGGFSGLNRPFWIVAEFKRVIEEFGRRDVGLKWSKNDLDAADTSRQPQADDHVDAERFRALMRCPRIKMQGSAGVNPHTGERLYPDRPGSVHFGAEFWPAPATDPRTGTVKIYEDCDEARTQWGHHALRALADDIIALEAANVD